MPRKVWVFVIHSSRRIIVTDLPGTPVGDGRRGDVRPAGDWTVPEGAGWGEAGEFARKLATARSGYHVRYETGDDRGEPLCELWQAAEEDR